MSDLAPMDKSTVYLTAREIEVARCLLRGASNKRIALQLKISDHTVRDHVSSLLRKFEVKSRTELAIELSHGFIVDQLFPLDDAKR